MILKIKNAKMSFDLDFANVLEFMTSNEKVALLSEIMDDEHVSISDVATAIGCSVVDADDLVSELIDSGQAYDPVDDIDDEDCYVYGGCSF